MTKNLHSCTPTNPAASAQTSDAVTFESPTMRCPIPSCPALHGTHCQQVPKTKTAVTSHPVSGSTRINLTFRQLQPDWAAAVPNCRCGRPSIMRCGLQAGRFVYYYACDNTKGPGCGLYQPAVALDPGSWRAVTESCWVSVDAR
jgi:hypothetical protein